MISKALLPVVATVCMRTDQPPVIDGKLDDGCWAMAAAMGEFRALSYYKLPVGPIGQHAPVQTRGYLLYDDETLFVGVHCDEPEMESLRMDVGPERHDGPILSQDDTIELYLFPDESTVLAQHEAEPMRFFHFAVNPAGARYDGIGIPGYHGRFDPQWTAAASRGDDSWQVELAIPFAQLGTAVADGTKWKATIVRNRIGKGEGNDYSSWAPVTKFRFSHPRYFQDFHDPSSLGQILFRDDPVAGTEAVDALELAGVVAEILTRTLDDIGAVCARASDEALQLPSSCRSEVEVGLDRINKQRAELAATVSVLTSAGFRQEWQAVRESATRLMAQAEALADEASMLAATDCGQRPWHTFVTKPITYQRLSPRRWPHDVPLLPLLSVTACPGEYEPATFSVYATKDLKKLTLSFSDLRSDQGDTLPASCIDPHVVKAWYQSGWNIWPEGRRVLTPELLLKDDDLVRVDYDQERNLVRDQGTREYVDVSSANSKHLKQPDEEGGFRPQDADELQPFDLSARNLKQFWLTVRVPEKAVPGLYRGTVMVVAGHDSEELPIEVTVLPFELLPSRLDYAMYYGGRLDGAGTSTFGSIRSEVQMRAELADLKAHGIMYPTRYGPYDEHILRRTLELRRQAGFPNDRMFSTARPNLQAGRERAAITDPDALARLEEEVRRYVEICREFGYEQIYIYGVDEANGQLLLDQLPSWEVVRKAGGEIFAAAREDAVDAVGGLIKVANRSYRPDPEEAEKWHKAGSVVYAYGNPQSGVSEPATYRRNFGLVLWEAGFDGAMEFEYACNFEHVWNDFDSKQYRDHKFVLPTVDGVIGTLQWEGFCEAIDDVRYMTTLEQALESAPPEKEHLVHEARAWMDGLRFDNDPHGHTVPMLYLDTDIMEAWKEQLNSETADLDEVREKIIGWVLRLQ